MLYRKKRNTQQLMIIPDSYVGHPLNDCWQYLPNSPNCRFVWYRFGQDLVVQVDSLAAPSCYFAIGNILKFIQERFNARAPYIHLDVQMHTVEADSQLAFQARFEGGNAVNFPSIRDLFNHFLIINQRSLQPEPGVPPPLPRCGGGLDPLTAHIHHLMVIVTGHVDAIRQDLQIPIGAVVLSRDTILPDLSVVAENEAFVPDISAPTQAHCDGQDTDKCRNSQIHNQNHGQSAVAACRSFFSQQSFPFRAKDGAHLTRELVTHPFICIWSTVPSSRWLFFWIYSDNPCGGLAIPFVLSQLCALFGLPVHVDPTRLTVLFPVPANGDLQELTQSIGTNLNEVLIGLLSQVYGYVRDGTFNSTSNLPEHHLDELARTVNAPVSAAIIHLLSEHSIIDMYTPSLATISRTAALSEGDVRLAGQLRGLLSFNSG